MQDLVYFSDNGLTTTSANHLANKAKEYVAQLENELKNISFVKEEIQLLDSTVSRVTKTGCSDSELDEFEQKLNIIAKAKSLCAWLREAIKEKANLTDTIKKKVIQTWANDNSIDYPEYPFHKDEVTEKDYLNTLSIKDRNRYYEVETYASVFGKFIHVDGPFYESRKIMLEKMHNPSEISGDGHDTIVYDYKPSVHSEKVDKVFFKLNEKYRSYQAELNAIKHTMQDWITKTNNDNELEYQDNYRKYLAEVDIINSKFKTWKNNELKKVSNLKIVIPNALQDIYELVNKL